MTKTELTAAVNARLNETKAALATLDDETALDVTVLFPEWQSGKAYAVDERIRYGENLYRCVQAHTSQADWIPPETPALWTEVSKPGEIPVWKQPTGAQDAYNKGDKVWYPDKNGDIWVSIMDNNIWAPDVFGWEKVIA